MTVLIGSRAQRLVLPMELWQEIFEHTHTLQDATAWQLATGVRAGPDEFKRLVRKRAPGVLLIVPEPQARTLWPGPTGPAPAMPAPPIDFMPLCGPIFFAPRRFKPTGQALSQLFDAALFMHGFAPQSPITGPLVSFASTAWLGHVIELRPTLRCGALAQRAEFIQLFEGCLHQL